MSDEQNYQIGRIEFGTSKKYLTTISTTPSIAISGNLSTEYNKQNARIAELESLIDALMQKYIYLGNFNYRCIHCGAFTDRLLGLSSLKHKDDCAWVQAKEAIGGTDE